jgi:glutaredoxin-like protein
MPMMDDDTREQVRQRLAELERPVKLAVFTQEVECDYCAENRALAGEVAELSDKIDIAVYDFVEDEEAVQRYHIDKIPAIAVEGEKDYGVRFYGVPFGYEFSSLLEAIRSVSTGDSGLTPESRERLAGLDKPVHLQVFITLT